MSKTDFETRAVLVLQHEATRMRNAAERVDLVVRAMALRRGVRSAPHEPEGADAVSMIV